MGGLTPSQRLEQIRQSEITNKQALAEGTASGKFTVKQAARDRKAGKTTDYTVIDDLRTGKEFDLGAALESKDVTPSTILRNLQNVYGVEVQQGPKQYTVELQEGLNIGSGQPPRPQGYPPSSQQQYSQKVLPQSYSDASLSVKGKTGASAGVKKVVTPPEIQYASEDDFSYLIKTGKAKSASEAAEMIYFDDLTPEGYDWSGKFNRNSGRAEDIIRDPETGKLLNWKEAYQKLGIGEEYYKEIPNADKPQRSNTQSQLYYPGIYANPNFDTKPDIAEKPETIGIQPYQSEYVEYAKLQKEDPKKFQKLFPRGLDFSAQYSTQDFKKEGGILQEPLSAEKKAYYSKPRESRGEIPWQKQYPGIDDFFKPMEKNRQSEAKKRLDQFKESQAAVSGGPDITVREAERFTGSKRIQLAKERAFGQQGTLENIPFVEARGLPSEYNYQGQKFATPTDAIRSKEEQNRLKRLEAEERRLADESRTDIGKGGKINTSGLLPKDKIDETPQLSESFETVIPDSSVVFSGLGSTQRKSPIPKRAKPYSVEEPTDEILYGNLGGVTIGKIEPVVEEKPPKEKPRGIPISDIYGKPSAVKFETPKGDNTGYESQGYGNLLGYNLTPKTEEPKPTGNSFVDFMNRAGYVNTEIAKGIDDLMYKISVDTLNTGSSIQAFLDPKNKEIYESQKYKRERSPSDDYWDYAFGAINDIEFGKRREKYYSEKGPIRAAVTEGGEVAYYVGDIALGGRKAITDIGEKIGPKIVPVLKKLNPEYPSYQPPRLDDIISGARKIIKKEGKLTGAKPSPEQIYQKGKRGEKISNEEKKLFSESIKKEKQRQSEITNMPDDSGFFQKNKPSSPQEGAYTPSGKKTGEFVQDERRSPLSYSGEILEKPKGSLPKGKNIRSELDEGRSIGADDWDKIYSNPRKGSQSSSELEFGDFGNIPKGTPESVGKVTLGGSKFINKKTGAIITGVTGTGILLGNEFTKNQNKPKSKSKDRDELALFPYLTQPQAQTPFLDQPQKEKEKQTPAQRALTLLELGQDQQSGQRLSQRQRYRLNVPQTPEEFPFFQQPQLPAERFAYDEPPINIIPVTFKPWLLRGGGDGGFGGDDTDQGWKFFRVFDVAKTPFGRVRKSVGYYEDSLAPNFEIQAYSKNPLALARPKDIAEEDIGNLFAEPKKRKYKKK